MYPKKTLPRRLLSLFLALLLVAGLIPEALFTSAEAATVTATLESYERIAQVDGLSILGTVNLAMITGRTITLLRKYIFI